MKRHGILRLCSALVILLPSVLGAAQGVGGLVQGDQFPPTLKFADVDSSYKAVKIRTVGSSGGDGMMGGGMGMMMMMFGAMAGQGGGGDEGLGMLLLGSLSDLYWSKGQTTSVMGHDYLVAYRLEIGLRPGAKEQGMSDVPPIGARLRLTLLRNDLIASLAPEPDTDIKAVMKILDDAKIPYDAPVIPLDQDEAVTTAILAPVFSQAKESAKRTATLSNAKQLALGMLMYQTDYDDIAPYAQSTAAVKYVTEPYLKNNDLWKSQNPNGGEFLFNMALAGVEQTEIPEPAETPMFFEKNAWPDGKRVVAFADGHAKVLTAEEWKSLQPMLKLKLKRAAKKPLPADYGVGGGERR